MEFRPLRYFIAVAEEGSFTNAAEDAQRPQTGCQLSLFACRDKRSTRFHPTKLVKMGGKAPEVANANVPGGTPNFRSNRMSARCTRRYTRRGSA